MGILLAFPFLFGGQLTAALASQIMETCDKAYAGMSSLEARVGFYHHNILRDELVGEPDLDKLANFPFPTDESFAGSFTWKCDAQGQFDSGFTPRPAKPGQETSEVWGLRGKVVDGQLRLQERDASRSSAELPVDSFWEKFSQAFIQRISRREFDFCLAPLVLLDCGSLTPIAASWLGKTPPATSGRAQVLELVRNVRFQVVEEATSKTERSCFLITLRHKGDGYVELNRIYIDRETGLVDQWDRLRVMSDYSRTDPTSDAPAPPIGLARSLCFVYSNMVKVPVSEELAPEIQQ